MIRRAVVVVLALTFAAPAVADRPAAAPLPAPRGPGPWGKRNGQLQVEKRRLFLISDGDVYLGEARQRVTSAPGTGGRGWVATAASDGLARHALDRYDEALRLGPDPEVHIRALAAAELLLESSADRWLRVIRHFDGLRATAPRDARETTLIPTVNTALSKLGAAGGPDADAYFARAVKEFETWYQRIDDGDPRFAKQISTYSTNSAELLMALGPDHLEHAIRLYEQGIQFDPMESLGYYGAAVAYDRDGQWAKAVEMMQAALERDPFGRPDWNDARGVHRMGRLSDDNVYFVPDGEVAYYHALGYQVQGQRAEALRHYRKYLADCPGTRFAARTREHIAELERPVKRALALLVACAWAGAAEAKPKPPAKPERNFWDRVARPDDSRWQELVAQGRALFDQERAAESVEFLTEATRLDPARPEAWFYLGHALLKLDRWAECAEALTRVDALRPGGWVPDGIVASRQPEPSFSLALCHAMAGHFEASVEQLEATLARGGLEAPTRALVLYNLGDSYHALGRLEDAVRAYEQAIAAAGRNEVAAHSFALAVALDRDEQGERAREVMREVLDRQDPGLGTLGDPSYTFLLPEEEDYYRGFAYLVAAEADARKGACSRWNCRLLARAYFRRFVARAPASPWRGRADSHLADLGGGGPVRVEIVVTSADNAAAAPYTRVVEKAAARLARCVEGKPFAVYDVQILLPGKRGPTPPAQPRAKGGLGLRGRPSGALRPPAPPPPTPPAQREFHVFSQSPGGSEETVRRCVLDVTSGLPWPKAASWVNVFFTVAP